MTKQAFFLLVEALPAWLQLSRSERQLIAAQHVMAAAAQFPDLSLRHFDAEAFCAFCSDILFVETTNIPAYYDFIETMRDSPIFSIPYFRLVQIIPAFENGFKAYESRLGANHLKS